MVWKTSLIAWAVGMVMAFGEAPKPDNAPRAKPKVIDLDFSVDDEDDEDWTPGAKSAAGRTSKGRWIYWTLGAGAAAAGGLGWYIFREEQQPEIIRNERVFTDER